MNTTIKGWGGGGGGVHLCHRCLFGFVFCFFHSLLMFIAPSPSPHILPRDSSFFSGSPFSFPQGKYGLDWIRQGKVGHWLWSVYSIVSVKVKPEAGVFPPAASAGQMFSLFLFISSTLLCYVKASLLHAFYSCAHTPLNRQTRIVALLLTFFLRTFFSFSLVPLQVQRLLWCEFILCYLFFVVSLVNHNTVYYRHASYT